MKKYKHFTDAIRVLSIDAIQKANSGHPGAPMGMADIAEVLWRRNMNYNPNNPKWFNRDRFILSNGHGSMLLYALLHLTGYDVSINDIKNFRQLNSKTAGHPEYTECVGVETTTGPLGQGIANGVGMAIAELVLAQHFNKEDLTIVDHNTFVFLGDGCLMEGISHEVCSLAGTLKLSKLIAFWDDNGISIDGKVEGWFTDNTKERFLSYGWDVYSVDGHNSDEIQQAISLAKKSDKPSIICCKTIIGFGSPNKQGTSSCHGSPLGVDEVDLTKKKLNWQHDPFEIPKEIYDGWDFKKQGQQLESLWLDKYKKYQVKYPELASEFERRINGKLPDDFDKYFLDFIAVINKSAKSIATRKSSLLTINALAKKLPELFGGSADLGCSNLTQWDGYIPLKAQQNNKANYIDYGVREFGMSAIINGIVLHKGLLPFGATFLVFSDYARNAIRMASLMEIPSIFVYTHDSIGLGEDGPTHQPIEHLSSLRIIPNIMVWRPCDIVETAISWQCAIKEKNTPSCLVFSRQDTMFQQRTDEQINSISKGGYILWQKDDKPKCIIISTGSEVELALQVAKLVDFSVRVVSMPCTNLFDMQDDSYKNYVLPKKIKRLVIEAGKADFWYKYLCDSGGDVLGINSFGKSAPAKDIYNFFNINIKFIVDKLNKFK